MFSEVFLLFGLFFGFEDADILSYLVHTSSRIMVTDARKPTGPR
jgi:hypothetical protein